MTTLLSLENEKINVAFNHIEINFDNFGKVGTLDNCDLIIYDTDKNILFESSMNKNRNETLKIVEIGPNAQIPVESVSKVSKKLGIVVKDFIYIEVEFRRFSDGNFHLYIYDDNKKNIFFYNSRDYWYELI